MPPIHLITIAELNLVWAAHPSNWQFNALNGKLCRNLRITQRERHHSPQCKNGSMACGFFSRKKTPVRIHDLYMYHNSAD